MYISVDTLLSAQHPYYRIGNLEVYLDGELQERVFALDTLGTLDEPRGWIRKHKTDENGQLVVVNGDIVCETLYGNVEVKVK